MAAPAGRSGIEQEDKEDETEAILRDVLTLFSQKDDVASIKEVGSNISDLKALADTRHKEMLNSIKELSGQLQRSKQEHNEQKQKLLNPAQKQQLLSERNRVDENIRRMREEADVLREKIGSEESKSLTISKEEQDIRQQENIEVPRARHTITLYANISSIRWDYKSTAAKGWITSASGAGLKAFELDSSRLTDFEIANHLWDIID